MGGVCSCWNCPLCLKVRISITSGSGVWEISSEESTRAWVITAIFFFRREIDGGEIRDFRDADEVECDFEAKLSWTSGTSEERVDTVGWDADKNKADELFDLTVHNLSLEGVVGVVGVEEGVDEGVDGAERLLEEGPGGGGCGKGKDGGDLGDRGEGTLWEAWTVAMECVK